MSDGLPLYALTPGTFDWLGWSIIDVSLSMEEIKRLGNTADNQRIFLSFFGTTGTVLHTLWNEIGQAGLCRHDMQAKHILWTAAFLKQYSTEAILSVWLGTNRTTLRKWVWIMLDLVSRVKQDVIHWPNRFRGVSEDDKALVTVDGVDIRIEEPQPFTEGWFSQKFKGPGVRYEVALSIVGGEIVWTNGPFPCGMWNDLSIFRFGLKNKLMDGEVVVADKGYIGDERVLPPKYVTDKILRARHETVNRRLKHWACMRNAWRHDTDKHILAFNAVATITQIELVGGSPLFDPFPVVERKLARMRLREALGEHLDRVMEADPNDSRTT
eukprot:CAMPEP_0198112844 /NCGR_PEP_ID=MMETSP1442-20131203/4629_1 /TAXON_ID= /ORGANISM="Craspedostauros australis, Strain CCMP3328" /LENGTH=325 /DNA_ID=CAMNT_0043769759 /DNA_START=44 /DNA_END=1021 /DNA_ORIENTATION=+